MGVEGFVVSLRFAIMNTYFSTSGFYFGGFFCGFACVLLVIVLLFKYGPEKWPQSKPVHLNYTLAEKVQSGILFNGFLFLTKATVKLFSLHLHEAGHMYVVAVVKKEAGASICCCSSFSFSSSSFSSSSPPFSSSSSSSSLFSSSPSSFSSFSSSFSSFSSSAAHIQAEPRREGIHPARPALQVNNSIFLPLDVQGE